MLPDMLGIQHRVQDIFLVKKSTDPSVSWLLSGGGIKEPLGQSLQSSSWAQYVPAAEGSGAA